MVKNLPANEGDAGDEGLIPGSGRSQVVGNGTPLQYSCLGNLMDRGTWWATVHGVTKTQRQFSDGITTTTTSLGARGSGQWPPGKPPIYTFSN